MKKRLLLCALISVFALSACNKEGKPVEATNLTKESQELMEVVEGKTENTELSKISEEAWVDANNAFGLKLLRHEPIETSVIASPFSIERALGMTLDGALGNTAKEMRAALSLPEASGLGEAGAQVEAKILKTLAGQDDDEAMQIRVVNRLWLEQSYKLHSEYLAYAKRHYSAEPVALDFVHEPDASRVAINTAIEKDTNGKIIDLIPSGLINDLTRLVLTNAIYFKSPWAKQFKEAKTEKAEFTSPTAVVEVDMMHMTEPLPHYKGVGFSALSLAYAGGTHALLVFLPEAREIEALAALEAKLDPKMLRDIMEKVEVRRVTLALPRFKVEKDISLKTVLKQFGMHDAFDVRKANFSKMTPSNDLYVSEVLHKAIIEVDENGTEAAAATAVIMMMRSMHRPDKEVALPFVADHPFTYMLVEMDSKAIVFAGRFVGK